MNKSGRTKNSTKNILIGIFKNCIMMIIAFISRKLFIVYIGVEYLGINGLFTNILSLLSMADLGFGTAMSFSFYKPLAENDHRKISALVNFYKKVYHFIAAGIFIIGVGIIPFLDKIINLETPIPHITLYYMIFLLNTVVSYLFIYKSSIISADQKNYLIDKFTIFVNVGKLLIQCLSLVIFKDYVIYISINIVATLINNLMISNQANKLYPYIKHKEELTKKEKKSIFNNLKSVFIYKISSSLLNSIDNIVISTYISTAAVGYYSNYYTVISSLISFITIIFTSLTASVGNLIVTESADKKYEIFELMQKISFWISGFVTICTYVLINDFISIWLGPNYAMGDLMAIAVALNLFFSTSMQPIWIFREATGLYRRTKYIMLIASGINLILSILFAKILGVPGVIIATILSRVFTYFWFEPNILFKEFFDRGVLSYYFDYFFNVFFVVLIGKISITIFNNLFVSNSWMIWFLKAIILTLFVNVFYIIINYKNGTIEIILTKIKYLLKK